jgi:hypothetical protein
MTVKEGVLGVRPYWTVFQGEKSVVCISLKEVRVVDWIN